MKMIDECTYVQAEYAPLVLLKHFKVWLQEDKNNQRFVSRFHLVPLSPQTHDFEIQYFAKGKPNCCYCCDQALFNKLQHDKKIVMDTLFPSQYDADDLGDPLDDIAKQVHEEKNQEIIEADELH
jgi:hypothetical protein